MITGKEIMDLGYKPGNWFRDAIDYVNSNHLEGDALRQYLEQVCPKHIEPRKTPLDYFRNIRVESPEEQGNVDNVFAAMDQLMKTPTVTAGAVMPDACPTGYAQIPVGGVVIAQNAIHPAMHSADICCSVMATNFGHADPKAVLNAAHSVTHFGPGGRAQYSILPGDLEAQLLANRYLRTE